MREQLYLKEGTMPYNFAVTLHDGEQKQKAMRAFRKNYKLNFIEIDDVKPVHRNYSLSRTKATDGGVCIARHEKANGRCNISGSK